MSCAAVAWLATSQAEAGTITGVGAIGGTGLGFVAVPVVTTPNPGVADDTNNIGVPIKRFDTNGYIDIEFLVRNSEPAGTTEYQIFEAVDNNTGINWIAYTVELGFGLGTGFQIADPSLGLTFDAPNFSPTPNSSAFSQVLTTPVQLVFSNGLQATGSETYQFWIDVPEGITSFTLRQYPQPIPEPGTLALAAMAIGTLGFVKFRRRRG